MPRRETATGEAALHSAPSGRKGDCVQRGRQQVLWHFWGVWRIYHYFLLPKAVGIKKKRAALMTQCYTRAFHLTLPNSQSTLTLQPDIHLLTKKRWRCMGHPPPFISTFQQWNSLISTNFHFENSWVFSKTRAALEGFIKACKLQSTSQHKHCTSFTCNHFHTSAAFFD